MGDVILTSKLSHCVEETIFIRRWGDVGEEIRPTVRNKEWEAEDCLCDVQGDVERNSKTRSRAARASLNREFGLENSKLRLRG